MWTIVTHMASAWGKCVDYISCKSESDKASDGDDKGIHRDDWVATLTHMAFTWGTYGHWCVSHGYTLVYVVEVGGAWCYMGHR